MGTSTAVSSTTESVRTDTERVKNFARNAGADLVGVADADKLNENPPDPEHPQIPSRVWEETNSVVVIALRVPLGEYMSDDHQSLGYLNQLVVHKVDRLSHEIARFIEKELGHRALQLANDETDPDLKRGSYGFLSLRHLAAEAGLGTFGLEANLLTPEFGPRVYFAAVLTTAELEYNERITSQICIGASCGRCLEACPTDAVEHFTLDKLRCGSAAQYMGVRSIIYGPLRTIIELDETEDILDMLSSHEVKQKFVSIVRKINAFGACPRCVEVCPIGIDYKKFLAQEHKNIPEATKDNEETLQEMITAEQEDRFIDGNKPVNLRWVGEDGYKTFLQVIREREDRLDDVKHLAIITENRQDE